MIGQIGPLVQGGESRTRIALSHLAGGLVGGAAAGVALGFIATALALIVGENAWRLLALVALSVALLLAGLADTRLLPFELLRNRNRQTPKSWRCVLGNPGASFAWAADLALAVTTRISYQALLIIPLASLLAPGFAGSVAIMATFGVTRAAVTVAATLGSDNVDSRTATIDSHYPTLKLMAGIGSLTAAIGLVAVQL